VGWFVDSVSGFQFKVAVCVAGRRTVIRKDRRIVYRCEAAMGGLQCAIFYIEM
jgi:hypothetical protein